MCKTFFAVETEGFETPIAEHFYYLRVFYGEGGVSLGVGKEGRLGRGLERVGQEARELGLRMLWMYLGLLL